MRYFEIKQDTSLRYPIILRDFSIQHDHRTFELDQVDNMKDITVLYLEGNGDEICPDYIEHPVFLINEELGRIFLLYEDDIALPKVKMIHKDAERLIKMNHLILKRIDALHERCEYYPDRRIKRLILDQKKIGDHQIFWLPKGCNETTIVSLNVVESMLRRHSIGVLFHEVEVI